MGPWSIMSIVPVMPAKCSVVTSAQSGIPSNLGRIAPRTLPRYAADARFLGRDPPDGRRDGRRQEGQQGQDCQVHYLELPRMAPLLTLLYFLSGKASTPRLVVVPAEAEYQPIGFDEPASRLMVNSLSDSRISFRRLPSPWPGLLPEVRVVFYRIPSGKLHRRV